MPRRRSITIDQEREIYSLHLRHTPIGAIAARMRLHRNTVAGVLTRITAELNDRHIAFLEAERQKSLDIYRELEAECWTRLGDTEPDTTVSVGYLNLIGTVRRQQDRLPGLEKIVINHEGEYLKQLNALMSQPVPIVIESQPRLKQGDHHDDD